MSTPGSIPCAHTRSRSTGRAPGPDGHIPVSELQQHQSTRVGTRDAVPLHSKRYCAGDDQPDRDRVHRHKLPGTVQWVRGAQPELTRDGLRHLVVGHSNTTPPLVELFGGDAGPPIDEASEYDRLYGSPDIKVGRSPGRSDQELCDLGRNRLIHGFFWDLPEQYFLASVDGRLRRPRSGWGACSAAAKSRRKVFNLWLLLDDRWAGDTAQVEPVR